MNTLFPELRRQMRQVFVLHPAVVVAGQSLTAGLTLGAYIYGVTQLPHLHHGAFLAQCGQGIGLALSTLMFMFAVRNNELELDVPLLPWLPLSALAACFVLYLLALYN